MAMNQNRDFHSPSTYLKIESSDSNDGLSSPMNLMDTTCEKSMKDFASTNTENVSSSTWTKMQHPDPDPDIVLTEGNRNKHRCFENKSSPANSQLSTGKMTPPFPNDKEFSQQIEMKISPSHHFPYVKLQRLSQNQPLTLRRSQYFRAARRFNRSKNIFRKSNSFSKYPKSQFNCHICHQRFNFQVALTYHLGTHAGEVDKPYACSQCDLSFEQSNLLKLHLVGSHSYKPSLHHRKSFHSKRVQSTNWQRKRCQKSHLQIKELLEKNPHLRLIVHAPKHSCPHCPRKFPFKCNLKRHILTHTKENHEICQICGSNYSSLVNLQRHQELKICSKKLDLKIRSTLKCEHCEQSFSNNKNRLQHMRKHHGIYISQNRPSYNCIFCGYQAPNPSSLEAHNRTHTGEKPFSCEACGKSFSRKQYLNLHTRNDCEEAKKLGFVFVPSVIKVIKNTTLNPLKKKDDQKQFKCSKCSQTFKTIGLKKNHESRHGDKNPCPFCPVTFAQPIALGIHITKFHPEKRTDYPCDLCDIVLKTKSAYANHMRTVHMQKGRNGRKILQCEYCEMGFTTEKQKEEHLKEIHEIIKVIPAGEQQPYLCLFCGYLAASSSHLNRHNLVHTGEKPFNCEGCRKSFSSKQYLEKHIRFYCKSTQTSTLVSNLNCNDVNVDVSEFAEVSHEIVQKPNSPIVGMKRSRKPVGLDPLAPFDVSSTLVTEEEGFTLNFIHCF